MKKFRFIEELGGDYDSLETRPVWLVGMRRNNIKEAKNMFTNDIWNVDKNVDGWEKYSDVIKTIEPGEYIIAKSTKTTDLEELPVVIDNGKDCTSLMLIKAIGRVIRNPGDGERLDVQWIEFEPYKKWYLNWFSRAVMCLNYNNPLHKEVINFAFYEQDQDFEKCLKLREANK